MKAIILPRIAPIEEEPLVEAELPTPVPKDDEVMMKVSVCGLCHTDLDEIEGRLPPRTLPVVLGHQVVGTVVQRGPLATVHEIGARVGVTWLYSSCGTCPFCRSGRENLCEQARWTGKDANGGYAEFMVVREGYAHLIPPVFSDAQAAPLLCAGVIGYRAIRLSEICDGQTVGLFGFGASAHIVIQLLRHQFPRSDVFVFTRGDEHKKLARSLGAAWAGSPADEPPIRLDRAIDFTPVGETVRQALSVLNKGGRVVVNAIRKASAVPELIYERHLWNEKEINSVANVTRQDAHEFLRLAADIPLDPTVEEVQPQRINQALLRLKEGKIRAAAVLRLSWGERHSAVP